MRASPLPPAPAWRGWHIFAFSPRQMHGPAQGFTASHHLCARGLRLPCKGVQYLFCSLVYTCALASVPPLVRRACYVSFVPEVRRGALGACALLELFSLTATVSTAVLILLVRGLLLFRWLCCWTRQIALLTGELGVRL